jgi:cbb3-type cytochrome oxidase subunit 3
MRIADITVATLVIASGFSWALNKASAMFIFTLLGFFLGGWYAMLRLLRRIPTERDRRAARERWRTFLGQSCRRK